MLRVNISYVGPNIPTFTAEYFKSNNRIIRCYSIIAIPSISLWRIDVTPHVGLRCALHQPTLSANLCPARCLTSIKAPISQQTGLGPTLAMSYPIDGRGRPECPALIRPERGGSRGRAARQRPSDGSRDSARHNQYLAPAALAAAGVKGYRQPGWPLAEPPFRDCGAPPRRTRGCRCAAPHPVSR